MVWRDVRHGMRLLSARPGFTAVAVATLALGIGANAAIFSLIKGILLNSVPFPAPEELVFLGEHSVQVPNMSVSYPNFMDWREQNQSFEAIAAHRYQTFNLTGLEKPQVLLAVQCSASLFPILRVEPILGRVFTRGEDRMGAERVALISHDFWQTRLGADPGAVGRTLNLDGQIYQILGVLPRGFLYPISNSIPDLWMPIEPFSEDWQERRGNHPGIYVTGRLKRGVSFEQARTEMESIARALAEEYPETNTGNGISFSSLTDRVVRDLRPALLVLSGAVAMVLLIACVNVANLLLARGITRQREIAIRTALGSSRWQLARQLLTESVLLAVFAGGFGVGIAYGALHLLRMSLDPGLLAAYGAIEIDVSVLAFTLVVSAVTGVVFGLLPARVLLRTELTYRLKEGGRGATSGHERTRTSLVVAEVALALVLLSGALLFIQSFRQLSGADPGFDERNVLAMTINLSTHRYPEGKQQAHFYERLLERARSLPGVVSAAITLPLLGGWQTAIVAEGQPPPPPGEQLSVDITRVSPGYFRTMGVRVLRGRVFTEQDREDGLPVAVVDETLAETFWPGENPLGKRVKLGGGPDSDAPWLEVVGVVNHVKNYGVAQPSRIELYVPARQNPVPLATLIVKTATDPRTLAAAVEQEVFAVDPDQPVALVRTLEEVTAATMTPQRLAAGFLGIFSAVALVLAGVGIYGLMAYMVVERRHEIGIRMALGASTMDILTMVVLQGFRLVVIGIAVGLTLALLGAPLLSSQLFGIEARDPRTFTALPFTLAVVALVACAAPAVRASRVHPVIALRYE